VNLLHRFDCGMQIRHDNGNVTEVLHGSNNLLRAQDCNASRIVAEHITQDFIRMLP
jgi:hypothetical protein